MADARVLHRLILLLVIAGIGFSAYATFEVLDPGLQTVCTVNAIVSCSAVTQSGHTSLGPVPDWAVGLGGFVLLLAIDVPLIRTYDARLLVGLFLVALIGLGVAGYLAYVEVAIIRAVCPVCLGAYVCDGGTLALSAALLRIRSGRSSSVAV